MTWNTVGSIPAYTELGRKEYTVDLRDKARNTSSRAKEEFPFLSLRGGKINLFIRREIKLCCIHFISFSKNQNYHNLFL